jgi:hypothetical protein
MQEMFSVLANTGRSEMPNRRLFLAVSAVALSLSLYLAASPVVPGAYAKQAAATPMAAVQAAKVQSLADQAGAATGPQAINLQARSTA